MNDSKLIYKFLIVSLIVGMLGFFINSVGMEMNNIVIESNGCKMPVLTTSKYSTDEHFTYQDWFSVKHPFLSDIFRIGNYIYSIGDFFIYTGGFLVVLFFTSLIFMITFKFLEIIWRRKK
jgi:hypothetical protein